MRQRLVRGYATAPLALVIVAFLASCSAGVEAGTLDEQHLSGAKIDAGLVKLRNALVVASNEPGGESSLVVTIINDGSTDDALIGVELTGPDGPIETSLRPTSVDLPAESATVIPGDTRPTVVVEGAVQAGAYVDATFDFETAGSATLKLLVLSSAAVYGGN